MSVITAHSQVTQEKVGAKDCYGVVLYDSNGSIISSFAGPTQYTEGDTDSSITGSAVLWEDISDTLRAVSAAKPLPVAPGAYKLDGATTHVKKYYTNSGAVTDGIVWSPAPGKRWYVTDIFVGVSAAATVTLEDDKVGGDEAVWKMELAANSGWSHGFQTPWYSGEDAADLMVTTTAGNVYITIAGYEA